MQQRLLIAAIVLVILLVNISCAGPELMEKLDGYKICRFTLHDYFNLLAVLGHS